MITKSFEKLVAGIALLLTTAFSTPATAGKTFKKLVTGANQ
jgi:hypothetical protein